MTPSTRLIALGLVWLSSACYGDKILSAAGGAGGGTGGGTAGAPSNGGGGSTSSDGGATSDGGHGGIGAGGIGDGGGGGPVSRCTPANEGMPCAGDEECETYSCLNEVCTSVGFAPASTFVGDNAAVGDCKGLFCSGVSSALVEGPSDDPPLIAQECFAPICSGGTPMEDPGPPGVACSTGVCSGNADGCVECISWANCPLDEVCRPATNTCGNCQGNMQCAGNPFGSVCGFSGSCGCDNSSNSCQTAAAGDFCFNGSCSCNSQDDCDGADFGTVCDLGSDVCSCSMASHCSASGMGHVCIMSTYCGCNADADCPAPKLCDVTAKVCVPP